MKNKVIWGVISLFLCVLSGIVGAYSMLLLQEHKTNGETLQVHRLELIDAHKGVRAEFRRGRRQRFLRMLSKENASVVELGVNENPGPYKQYTPSGSLTIRDGTGTPAIRLRTLDKGEAALSFSSTGNPEILLVGVGYSHYGDVIDGHDRGNAGPANRWPESSINRRECLRRRWRSQRGDRSLGAAALKYWSASSKSEPATVL